MRIIKRYANRKLYDTHSSQYITLEQLAKLLERGEKICVIDKNSGKDLTQVTLAQIELKRQKKAQHGLRQRVQDQAEMLMGRLSVPITQLRHEALAQLERYLIKPGFDVAKALKDISDEKLLAILTHEENRRLKRNCEDLTQRYEILEKRLADSELKLREIQHRLRQLEESDDS